jgi:tRNA A37 threonylcarbamoyladenosine biosynthesis protein TsaE
LAELEDLGVDELLDGEHILVVEWGGVVDAAFGADRLDVEIHYADPGSETARSLTLRPRGPSWSGRLGDLV